MESGQFAWKAMGLGPHFRVEISDDGVTICRNHTSTFVPFEGMEEVYLQEVIAPPMSEQLHVELVDTRGTGFSFHGAGYGSSTTDLSRCRDAAAAMLRKLAVARHDVRIFLGPRKGRPSRFLVVGMVLLAVAGMAWAFDHVVLGNPQRATGIGLGLAIAFSFGTIWTYRTTANARPIPVVDALGRFAASGRAHGPPRRPDPGAPNDWTGQ